MRITRVALRFVIALGCPAVAFPQEGPALPPIRQLGSRLAISRDSLGTISGIRQLSDGRVIVNDITKHKLLLFDSTLSRASVIADSTASTKKAYGAAQGGLYPYMADTTLFVDPMALSMLVIDPHGSIVRTVAPPRPSDAPTLALQFGEATVDAAGRLVYRDEPARCNANGLCGPTLPRARGPVDSSSSAVPAYALHDSVAILRGDIATHIIDTVGFLAVPYSVPMKAALNSDGSATMTQNFQNLISYFDDWAVVSDGSVAFVRARDYHVDWVSADGSHSSTPKIAHDWRRLSDSEKTAIVDSAKRYVDSVSHLFAAQQAKRDSIDAAHGGPPARKQISVYLFPDPSELPDYRPVSVLQSGFVKADADNDLWIRQDHQLSYLSTDTKAGALFDIVDRQGRLIDRVQLPPSMGLAGFGPGVVYLTSREGTGTVIVKYRIR